MAFIEIEECLRNPDFNNNRFILTVTAAKRASDLIQIKDQPLVKTRSGKYTTTALQEILAGRLTTIPETAEILAEREQAEHPREQHAAPPVDTRTLDEVMEAPEDIIEAEDDTDTDA